MPIKSPKRTLMPANARNADVASRLIDSIMPIQQQKVHAAFRVQGFQGVLYNRLTCGRKCTCKAEEKTLSQLSPDGKASPGIINRLLTNDEFSVTPYANQPSVEQDDFYAIETSPSAPVNKHQGTFQVKATQPNANMANVLADSLGEGAEGADNSVVMDIDSLVSAFDLGSIGFNDVACPVCFGSGFVGGYEGYRTFRHVVVPTEMEFEGFIDFNTDPWKAPADVPLVFRIVLPKGGVGVDAFKTYNGRKVVKSDKKIDGVPLTDPSQLLSFCDGRVHEFTVTSPHPLSHVEIQLNLSLEPAWFELPRRSKSSDVTVLDATEPFQIQMSPEIPQVMPQDVIVESQQGKYLLVQSSSPWETRNRSLLSPEVTVRVVQPQELFSILPTRGKILGQRTTNTVNAINHKRYSGASDES